VVALGATAGAALAGRAVTISRERNQPVPFGKRPGFITIHPSAILRIKEAPERHQAMADFVRDLKSARDIAARGTSQP
jgi:DNA polymerase